MTAIDLLASAAPIVGSPGEVGAIVFVAIQLGRIVRRLDVLDRRVSNVEAQAHRTAAELDTVRRFRGQRHA